MMPECIRMQVKIIGEPLLRKSSRVNCPSLWKIKIMSHWRFYRVHSRDPRVVGQLWRKKRSQLWKLASAWSTCCCAKKVFICSQITGTSSTSLIPTVLMGILQDIRRINCNARAWSCKCSDTKLNIYQVSLMYGVIYYPGGVQRKRPPS
jgi:hypothetical protein